MSADQVAVGLASCITRPDGWPPALPEFRAMCIGDAPRSAAHRRYVSLPAPRAAVGVVTRAVGSMRRALGVRGTGLSAYATLHGGRVLV